MIYGDPFLFSIQFDAVGDWTDSNCFWINGLFSVFVAGERLLDIVDVIELKTTVNFYAKMKFEDIKEGDSAISAKELFASAHGYFFKEEAVVMEDVQDMTCTFLGDAGLFIYFQKTEHADRLVWSKDFGNVVHEALLPRGVVSGVIGSIDAL
ncbi:Imm42 family immunity protein [Pseudomonas sp. Eth.TT006]